MMINPKIFMTEGEEIGRFGRSTPRDKGRCFHGFFGITPLRCAMLWKKMTLPAKTVPKHLLWALRFLCSYQQEDRLASMVGVSEKTFRKWTWLIVIAIVEVDRIKWWNRYLGWEGQVYGGQNQLCYRSIDGMDFRICEPLPFSPKWFSHKFKGREFATR